MNEVFHRIRHLGRNFTSEEWGKYCEASRLDDSKRIRTKIGKYTFNDCDVCLNPETLTIQSKGGNWGYYVTLKWADCGNGLWAFGLDYSTGMGEGGFDVSWTDHNEDKEWLKGYPSELECKLAAAETAIRYLKKRANWNPDDTSRRNNTNRLILMVEEWRESLQPKKPKYIQLDLFADFDFG